MGFAGVSAPSLVCLCFCLSERSEKLKAQIGPELAQRRISFLPSFSFSPSLVVILRAKPTVGLCSLVGVGISNSFNRPSLIVSVRTWSTPMLRVLFLAVWAVGALGAACNDDAPAPMALPIADTIVDPAIPGSWMRGVRASIGTPAQDIVVLPWPYVSLTPDLPIDLIGELTKLIN